jgi:8-oxo-dGTP pyrophosphatase MutT (NUDIX family)
MINYVVVYAHTEEGMLPLVLKNKPEHLKGMLNLPGGKIEAGEDPIDAAIRELKEETGLEPESGGLWDDVVHLGVIEGTTCVIHCVKVKVNFGKIKPGETETEKVEWYSSPEIYELPNLMPNLRVTIPLMGNNVAFSIIDHDGGWRENEYHNVVVYLSDNNPLKVQVRSCGYFKEKDVRI